MTQENHCTVCFTAYSPENPKQITLNCASSCCIDCLVEWALLKIQETKCNVDSYIPCISSSCHKMVHLQEIYKQIDPQSQEKLSQEFLKVYINIEKDISQCPRQNCPYAVIINAHDCKDDLQCELCGNIWSVQQQAPPQNLLSIKNEYLSKIWKKMFTKQCPFCRTPIERIDGCYHMTCSKCSREFCWICPSTHPYHTHYSYYIIAIAMALVITILLFSWLYSSVPMFKLVMDAAVVPILSLPFVVFHWIGDLMLACLRPLRYLLVFNALLLSFNSLLNLKTSRKPRFKTIVLMSSIIVALCAISYQYNIHYEVIKTGCIESVVIGIAGLIYKLQ